MDIALTTEQMKHYQEVAKMLSDAYKEAAKDRLWCEVVPVAEKSRKHALGSKEAWVDGFNLSMLVLGQPTYHPNLAGHTAVADMLYQRIVVER